MKKVKIITDGACLGNPGPGGWACILRYDEHKRELYGCAPHTTNNRMELTAAIEGLKALEGAVRGGSDYRFRVREERHHHLDSQLEAAQLDDQPRRSRWSIRTSGRSWTTWSAGTKLTWSWTKGHASHADNNRCDELAQMAAREQRRSAG